MTAIAVLRQRHAVHLMCDLAAYENDGILRSVAHEKSVPMPAISAAVACTGPAMLGAFFADRLSEMFRSFDELVMDADDCLPKLFTEYADDERDGDANSTCYFIGWHARQHRPAAYAMDMWTDSSTRISQVLANGSSSAAPERFKLKEQLIAGTPTPGQDLLAAAGWSVPDDENDVDPETWLLHLMEIMRHEEIEGRHWVGGGAFLTSIDRKGISQRVVHLWEEDEIGEFINPLPIDYGKWLAARSRITRKRRVT